MRLVNDVVTKEETVEPKDRQEWRRWLETNHETSKGIWIVFHKKASKERKISYEEAVEEALSFGWIDSLVRPIDELRYKQRYTPRKKGSIWSRTNKARVERLINAGRMTPAGLAKIEEAKADGSWDRLERSEEVPADLIAALEADPEAKRNFEAYSLSHRRMFLWWLADAKRAATRSRRISEIVEMAKRKETMVQRLNRKRSP